MDICFDGVMSNSLFRYQRDVQDQPSYPMTSSAILNILSKHTSNTSITFPEQLIPKITLPRRPGEVLKIDGYPLHHPAVGLWASCVSPEERRALIFAPYHVHLQNELERCHSVTWNVPSHRDLTNISARCCYVWGEGSAGRERPGALPDCCPHGFAIIYRIEQAPWATARDYMAGFNYLVRLVYEQPKPLKEGMMSWKKSADMVSDSPAAAFPGTTRQQAAGVLTKDNHGSVERDRLIGLEEMVDTTSRLALLEGG